MAGPRITATHAQPVGQGSKNDCNIDARNQIFGDSHNPLTLWAELTAAVVPSPHVTIWSFNSGCRYCCRRSTRCHPNHVRFNQQHQRISVRWTRPHPTPRHPRRAKPLSTVSTKPLDDLTLTPLTNSTSQAAPASQQMLYQSPRTLSQSTHPDLAPHRVPVRFRPAPRISTQLHARRQQRQRVHRPARRQRRHLYLHLRRNRHRCRHLRLLHSWQRRNRRARTSRPRRLPTGPTAKTLCRLPGSSGLPKAAATSRHCPKLWPQSPTTTPPLRHM